MGVAGGKHACDVCAHEQVIGPRVEVSIEASASEPLRRQDPLLPRMPDDVAALTGDGTGPVLRTDAAADAMALWQSTRTTLLQAPSDEVAHVRFFHLTMLLYRHTKIQRDDEQLRALLESALEVTGSHRNAQIFRCVLSRAALRAEDRAAAEDWLGPCDRSSGDLHADGAYRYTAALLASHKRQHAEVLKLLGRKSGDVPLPDNLDLICAVLRANAHEHGDAIDTAVAELSDCMKRIPNGPREVEGAIRAATPLVLCRQSFVKARRRYDEETGGRRDGSGAKPSLAPTKFPIRRAVPWLGLSLFFLGLAIMTDASSQLMSGQRLDILFFVIAGAFFVPIAVLVVRRRA